MSQDALGYCDQSYGLTATAQPEKERRQTMSSVESLRVFRQYMAEEIPRSLQLYAVEQRARDALRTVEQRARDAMRTYDVETEEITPAIPVDETE